MANEVTTITNKKVITKLELEKEVLRVLGIMSYSNYRDLFNAKKMWNCLYQKGMIVSDTIEGKKEVTTDASAREVLAALKRIVKNECKIVNRRGRVFKIVPQNKDGHYFCFEKVA